MNESTPPVDVLEKLRPVLLGETKEIDAQLLADLALEIMRLRAELDAMKGQDRDNAV